MRVPVGLGEPVIGSHRYAREGSDAVFDDDRNDSEGSDRWTLAGLALAAVLLIAGTVGLIAYEDAQTRAMHPSTLTMHGD